MFSHYLLAFFVSMLPVMELRVAIPIAVGLDLPYIPALIVCVCGNMLPVPFIFYFARKVLVWGSTKKYIGGFCRFFVEKGEKAGAVLHTRAGKYGFFFALLLFVGIPIPGTGAWTGTLAASFLNADFRSTVLAVCLGVVLAGLIMAAASTGVFSMIGL